MFEIKVSNLHWLENMDETEDTCLHGDAWVRIGDEILEFENATVSATAFYLLRSLKRNHTMYQMGVQLLPCCGFDMYFLKGELIICGCPNGIDWSVVHENGQIKLITETGQETVLPFEEYQKTVCAFADEIEAFYRNAKEKVFDDEKTIRGEEDREVYTAFWKEWHQIRDKFA